MSSEHELAEDDGPLFTAYLESDFPCDDLFFNEKRVLGAQSPILDTYSQDNRGSSSPSSNLSTSSKASFDEVDLDISLAIQKESSNDDPIASNWSQAGDLRHLQGSAANANGLPTVISNGRKSNTNNPSYNVSYQLNLHGMPTKSRVETQIRLGLQLVSIMIYGDTTREIELGDRFQWLKLPSWAMAKEKLKIQNRRDAPATIAPGKIVFLDARVVKSSDPLEDVTICPGCITRERKRAQRKKDLPKQMAGVNSSETPSRPKLTELMPLPDEEKKILVFNCPELLEFTNGEVTIPTRITCYCRHHKEKDGFRIIVTLRDASNNVLACTSSELVLITDDHKTTGKVLRSNGQVVNETTNTNSCTTLDNGMSSRRSTSRRSSCSIVPSRKRKAEVTPVVTTDCTQNKIQKIPSALSMTNLVSQRSSRQSVGASTATSRAPSPTTSRPLDRSPSQDSLLMFINESQYTYPSATSDVRPAASPQDSVSSPEARPFQHTMHEVMQDKTISSSPQARTWDYIRDTSIHTQPTSTMHVMQYESSVIMPPTPQSEISLQSPVISRIIPAEGPLQGGVEITMLGSGFRPGMTAMFGDAPAVPTHCWSTTTLVCVLPPATNAGPVPVSFKEHSYSVGARLFTYVDHTDRALYELALQVIGLKTTGRLETARDVAMRICASKMPSESTDVNFSTMPLNHLRKSIGVPRNELGAEELVIHCLRFSDDCASDRPMRLSLRSRSGHTLLHLAVIQGYSLLVQELLTRGANANIRDRASHTPLHCAALHGRRDIAAQLLLQGRANIALCTSNGRTAYDLAEPYDDSDLLDILDPWQTATSRMYTTSGRSTRSNSFDSDLRGTTTLSRTLSFSSAASESSATSELRSMGLDSESLWTGSRENHNKTPSSRGEVSISRETQSPTDKVQPWSRGSQRLDLCDNIFGSASAASPEGDGLETHSSEAQNLAANFIQLQHSWTAFLAETSPAWLQKTLANANASIPEVFKAPSSLSSHMPISISPITAFQALLPQIPQLRSLSRSESQGRTEGSDSSGPDVTWLQTLVASLAAPPSYAEAVCGLTSPDCGAERMDTANATEDLSLKLATDDACCDSPCQPNSAENSSSSAPDSQNQRTYFWQSALRSQGRVAGLTPEQQRAQVKKLQKSTDPRLYFLWLPCLFFFMLISVSKAFLNKVSELIL